MRTSLAFTAAILLIACSADTSGKTAQRADAGRSASVAPVSGAPVTATAPVPTASSVSAEIPAKFASEADSILRATLPRLAFASESAAPSLEECDMMDEGLPPAFAATNLRLLGDKPLRTHLERDPDNGTVNYLASFAVEIRSAATLTQSDGAGQSRRFDATVKSRIDTAEMLVSRAQLSGKWSICEPLRYRDGSPLEPWSFVQASDTSIRVEHWDPPTMSWSALADSARESMRRPEL